MPLDLIDIGANLAHDSFDVDRDQVIARAREAGVCQFVLTGSNVAVSTRSAAIAAERPGVLFATAGIHPHHASEANLESTAALAELCTQPQVVAIGECGLDYFRNFSTPNEQADAFEQQLQLAVTCELPVFLHQRDAHAQFVEILAPFVPRLTRAVAHCFTGSAEELARYVELGLYVGITGWICDERRGLHLRDLVAQIPPERVMIETDAPYLMPRDLRPKPKTRRNEPCHLPHILNTVAQCRGESPQTLARQTSANARRFFQLPPPDST